MHHPSHLIALLVVISGCDEPTDREAVSGGVVYYSRYDFTGGALPLAVGGFGNYHEVGPSLGFAPPYSAVVSTGFFGTGAAAEVHAMQGGVPVPDVVDTCRTTTDFSDGEGLVPVDAGDSLTVLFPETDAAIMLQRYPVIYEGGQEDTDVYYFGASAWRPEPVHTRVPGASDDPLAMDRSVLVSENFSHGELATLGFPGGLAPEGAGVASIPMPSTSVGSSEFYLPNEVEGVRLAWTGPRFDADGEIIG